MDHANEVLANKGLDLARESEWLRGGKSCRAKEMIAQASSKGA